MASSTTMPMASTSPNSEMLLRLKPTAAITANVPTMATGTAIIGISTERQFCRNTSTTSPTRTTASNKRLDHVLHRLADEGRGVVGDVVLDAVGEAASSAPASSPARARPRPGRWCREAGRRPGPPRAGRRRWRLGCSSGAPISTRPTSRRRTMPAAGGLGGRRPSAVAATTAAGDGAAAPAGRGSCRPLRAGRGRLPGTAGGGRRPPRSQLPPPPVAPCCRPQSRRRRCCPAAGHSAAGGACAAGGRAPHVMPLVAVPPTLRRSADSAVMVLMTGLADRRGRLGVCRRRSRLEADCPSGLGSPVPTWHAARRTRRRPLTARPGRPSR